MREFNCGTAATACGVGGGGGPAAVGETTLGG